MKSGFYTLTSIRWQTDSQTEYDSVIGIPMVGPDEVGQRLTIPRRYINKLGFWLSRGPAVIGDHLHFLIRNLDDEILTIVRADYTKVISGVARLIEADLPEPIYINDEVRLAVAFSAEYIWQYLNVHYKDADVKPNECLCIREAYETTDYPEKDCAYQYTFSLLAPPEK